MRYRAILFDLDGTLLPQDLNEFLNAYFRLLSQYMAPMGYSPDKLLETILAGMQAMVNNDGRESNETVFWNTFISVYGEKAREDENAFETFYRDDFDKLQKTCGYNPIVPNLIHELRDRGYLLVLATNPLFPEIATRKRAHWAGADLENFALYTTYENSYACKPHVEYYRQIVEKLGVQPEECLMVGNDVTEDMVAKTIGMDVFLITDCLINRDGADISQYRNGSFEDLLRYVDFSEQNCSECGQNR